MLFTYGAINQPQEMIYEGATYKTPPLWGTEKDQVFVTVCGCLLEV